MLGQQKKIHFIGVGGIGMSGMAELLNNLGHVITGSDLSDSDRTRYLVNLGIEINIGHNTSNIKDHDLVVYSSAVNENNSEIQESRSKNIPVIKRAEMLGELLKVKSNSVAVAGTHGKTTTSSMLSSILTSSGDKPTLIVGGIVQDILSNSILGDGDTIIVEADEYDRTLLSLKASMSIVTNIDYEHSDCYDSLSSLKETFLTFMNSTSFYGINVICYDDPNIKTIINNIKRPFLKYGKSPECDIRYEKASFNKGESSFDLIVGNKNYGDFKLQVPGEHNILNSLAAIGIAIELNIPMEEIREGIYKYKGVKRRFEIKYITNNNIIVIDDYAHHPSEIDATIKAAKSGWDINKLIIVFQPHLYSRTKEFHEEFSNVLSKADIVILTDIYGAREEKIEGINSELILKDLKCSKSCILPKSKIPSKVASICSENDMIIVMGAGDIRSLTNKISNEIQGIL